MYINVTFWTTPKPYVSGKSLVKVEELYENEQKSSTTAAVASTD